MPASTQRQPAPSAPASVEPVASPDAKRRPLRTIRVEDVNATIWPREVTVKGVPTIFYSVSFERSFRDANGRWRYTRYFDLHDLGRVIAAAQQAAEYIDSLTEKQQDAA